MNTQLKIYYIYWTQGQVFATRNHTVFAIKIKNLERRRFVGYMKEKTSQ